MGVRFLQTFIERKVPGGTYHVQICREIEAAKTGFKKPLIVIDLMALFGLCCRDKHTLLCGSQIALAERMAADFFSRLTDAGAELVFFYDGTLQSSKYETWTRRQNEKYAKMIAILDAVDRGTPVTEIVNQYAMEIPNNTSGLKLENVAKQHGKLIVTTHVECDQALAAYAVEHKALAVVAQDTDFLIYPGDWQLWSVNYINLETLETMGYDKNALLMTLRLRWDQMAVFATLAGNDFFKFDELEPFHNSLGPRYQKFERLSDYVRALPQGKHMNKKMIDRILARVYNGRRIPPEASVWFSQSLSFYSTDSKALKSIPPMDALQSFLLKADQHFVLTILTGQPFNCTLYFFDYRSPTFGSYLDIIETIISRIAGIILFHHQPDGRRDVVVMTKSSHMGPHGRHTVPAEFPTKTAIPSLMELHSSADANTSKALLVQKLELLAWVCSDQLPPESFAAVPPRLLVTIMTLFRLAEFGALSLKEADLLLWIAHELSTDRFDPSAERRPSLLDPRAFRIGFLFLKVYAHCVRAAKSLGLPREYCLSAPYDGLRFHNQYSAWHQGPMQHHIKSIADWRLYSNVAKEGRTMQVHRVHSVGRNIVFVKI